MKNKRLVIILSIFAFLALIVVLCSTLFTVRSVTFSWDTEKTYLADYTDGEMSGSVKKGQSVFLLNKSEIESALEQKYAYLKVRKVEIMFPNKLIIHVSERVNLYALKIENNKYAILDEYSKVLDIVTSEEYSAWDTTKSVKPIEVSVTNNGNPYTIPENQVKVGHIADVKRVTQLMSDVAKTMYTFYDTDVELKGRVYSMNINIAYRSQVSFVLTSENMTMQIFDCYSLLPRKIELGLSVFQYEDEQGITTGKIVVEGVNVGDYYYVES